MADMKREPGGTNYAHDAFRRLEAELFCVDAEHIKRAFLVVWLARGKADKAIVGRASDASKSTIAQSISGLDQPFWD